MNDCTQAAFSFSPFLCPDLGPWDAEPHMQGGCSLPDQTVWKHPEVYHPSRSSPAFHVTSPPPFDTAFDLLFPCDLTPYSNC